MNHIRKDHPLPHMISRREFIKNSGLGIAAVALSACTGNKVVQSTATVPSNTAVPSSPTPVSGQTLTIGLATGPVGMDPDFHGGREGHTIHRNCSAAPLMFPPLSIGANYQSDFNKLNGDLAQEWKVNSDWSGITVTLKQGIMSSAGNELTADDVIYKFQRSEALKGTGWGLNSLALQITHANEVTKDGKYTFTVHGEKPSILMEMFQTHDMSVLYDTTEMQKHKTADDPWATKWAASNWVGYGPYQVTEWVAGDRLVFERNKNYFNPKALSG